MLPSAAAARSPRQHGSRLQQLQPEKPAAPEREPDNQPRQHITSARVQVRRKPPGSLQRSHLARR